jgi:hypothetical protein
MDFDDSLSSPFCNLTARRHASIGKDFDLKAIFSCMRYGIPQLLARLQPLPVLDFNQRSSRRNRTIRAARFEVGNPGTVLTMRC